VPPGLTVDPGLSDLTRWTFPVSISIRCRASRSAIPSTLMDHGASLTNSKRETLIALILNSTTDVTGPSESHCGSPVAGEREMTEYPAKRNPKRAPTHPGAICARMSSRPQARPRLRLRRSSASREPSSMTLSMSASRSHHRSRFGLASYLVTVLAFGSGCRRLTTHGTPRRKLM
jgi:hypothetical protein